MTKDEQIRKYLERQSAGKTKIKPPKLSAEAIKTIKCIEVLEKRAQQEKAIADAEAKVKEVLLRNEKMKPVYKPKETEREQINFTESISWNKNAGDFQRTQAISNGGSFGGF